MADLILVVLAVDKAVWAKSHRAHYLWAASKLLKCARQAREAGWLAW